MVVSYGPSTSLERLLPVHRRLSHWAFVHAGWVACLVKAEPIYDDFSLSQNRSLVFIQPRTAKGSETGAAPPSSQSPQQQFLIPSSSSTRAYP